MKFLANENIPLKFIERLKEDGHDIKRVDLIQKGLSDEKVIELTIKEDRVLITFDKDFGEKAFKCKKEIKGIILLRIRPVSIEFMIERFKTLLKNFPEIERKFIVLEETKIRERSFTP